MEELEKLLKERIDFLEVFEESEYKRGQVHECFLLLHHVYLQQLTIKNKSKDEV